jgi:hypothetical protein
VELFSNKIIYLSMGYKLMRIDKWAFFHDFFVPAASRRLPNGFPVASQSPLNGFLKTMNFNERL